VIFASYPRSGNTFLRKYLEEITGIATGSDMTTEMTMCIQLDGFKGEEIWDDTVWIAKSHYPFPTPNIVPFEANKIICVVRNPLDTMCSLLQIISTRT